jgi:two-component system sensor histidine kinase CiaH
MPDGVGAVSGAAPGDPADERARATDNRLIRDVRVRLVLWSGLSTLLVLLVLGAALYFVVAGNLEKNGNDQLAARTAEFARRPFGPGQGFSFGGGSSGTFALIANDAGQQVGPSAPFIPDQLPLTAGIDAARISGVDTRTAVVNGVPVRVRTTKADSDIGTVYVQVIQDRSAEIQTLDAMRNILLGGGLVVIAVAALFGWVYARRALVPIRESLVQQRAALRRQREFAADASHELRTPLTVIRSSVERLRRVRAPVTDDAAEALADIDAEVGHLTALVEDLLLLARSDSGAISLTLLPVDLGDVAAEGAGGLVSLAAGRGVTLALDPEPAIVDGDQARLRQLIVILVDNAIRHTPRDGQVAVTVRSDAREAVLEVDDDGAGIRPEDMPHVFERFWRAPGAAAGGTGLGLAIAKSIVDLHEGRIVVMNRPQGGARFIVRLPAAKDPPVGAAERGARLTADPASEAR